MKTSNASYLNVTRIDLTTRKFIDGVSSFDGITDLNEIQHISLGHFYSKEERNKVAALFPKSYKALLPCGLDFDTQSQKSDFENPFYCVSFSFNTYFTNNVTGEKNEAATVRREKVIKKIKEYLKSL